MHGIDLVLRWWPDGRDGGGARVAGDGARASGGGAPSPCPSPSEGEGTIGGPLACAADAVSGSGRAAVSPRRPCERDASGFPHNFTCGVRS
ncbi:hypothetical protein OHA_1_04333 [Pleomorphomonas sp. SM30]|uniref:Uncharacterized protein n=1 Tax=Oharaeibacter diazotrophicus TaxID=1920512 RepID=A0A4R6RM30_9HYPH|nr:hypothetical protein EDD54_1618 [Oharaeibacter diazotrophicus]BBE74699.1 hypothetical protein OHA_1_04333 [Pleomorphomonas sp. SM30]GLS77080.1 hypothetical protein GCM10007904_24170 [Oharaeibacter diazotrophicus]